MDAFGLTYALSESKHTSERNKSINKILSFKLCALTNQLSNNKIIQNKKPEKSTLNWNANASMK